MDFQTDRLGKSGIAMSVIIMYTPKKLVVCVCVHFLCVCHVADGGLHNNSLS